VKNNCASTNRSGDPCRAAPRTGRPFCIFHDPGFARQRRDFTSHGGRASRPPAPGLPGDFTNLLITFEDRTSIQAAIDVLVRLNLFGKIPLNRSSHLLRAISLAVRNFDSAGVVPSSGHSPAHDNDAYWARRSHLDDAIADIARALADDHATTRAEAISDARARVYETCQARDIFARD
jgi:hypothetical protein